MNAPITTRRRVVLAIGGSALALPLASLAQKVYTIGFLGSEKGDSYQAERLDRLRAGLRDLGYVEGRNIVIDARWAEGAYDRLPALAAELVARKVDVIVSAGAKASVAAHNATTKIPIVVSGGDVVGLGLTTNLGRPSGNVTGWANVASELSTKLLELVKEAAPRVTRVAFLVNPADPPPWLPALRSTAASLKVGFMVFEARAPREFEPVFARIAATACDAVLVQGDTLFVANAQAVANLALKHRLVSASVNIGFADVGGLMSFGPDTLEGYRRAAYFVDKLLKGAKPGDLPIEQPARFDLIINTATAKALGLSIPRPLALRARLI